MSPFSGNGSPTFSRVLGELAADDAAGLVLLEGLELVGRDGHVLVVDGEDRVGVDANWAKGIVSSPYLPPYQVNGETRRDPVDRCDLRFTRAIGTGCANPCELIVMIRL